MEKTATGQVSKSAADFYEEFFVPALFLHRTGQVLDAADLKPGQSLLDVGCGTGVLARDAFARVSPGGTVTGVDLNDGMIATARRTAPDITWVEAPAEKLPFDDASFDTVISQFALMFFANKDAALNEMKRVLKPGGRLAVAVWDALENTPGYHAMTDLLARLFGDQIANELRTPYAFGDIAKLRAMFEAAGIVNPHIETKDGTAKFASLKDWIDMDVKGWTLGDMIDDEQYQLLLKEAEVDMKRFVQADGSIAFSSPAHIVSAVK